ncbi:hypothetical protein N7D90_24340 (plasmid) [Pseudomonas fragi]|uniref:hypothetical protein n=1 Tax=Pseudomonas fragi TaxID=296 RepID=UPI0021C23F9E|nr:hypothetical protein [Pseudomonas fragi]UXL41062.1 hypothetical protein N7D90_24340 [Pseudomonas fragi]
MSVEAEIKDLMVSPAASLWIKQALKSALSRDYIDAANDADLLLDLLDRRATEKLGLDAQIIPAGKGAKV